MGKRMTNNNQFQRESDSSSESSEDLSFTIQRLGKVFKAWKVPRGDQIQSKGHAQFWKAESVIIDFDEALQNKP